MHWQHAETHIEIWIEDLQSSQSFKILTGL